eukprot:10706880-Karenia_brevis.AAC.1
MADANGHAAVFTPPATRPGMSPSPNYGPIKAGSTSNLRVDPYGGIDACMKEASLAASQAMAEIQALEAR